MLSFAVLVNARVCSTGKMCSVLVGCWICGCSAGCVFNSGVRTSALKLQTGKLFSNSGLVTDLPNIMLVDLARLNEKCTRRKSVYFRACSRSSKTSIGDCTQADIPPGSNKTKNSVIHSVQYLYS